MNHIKNIVLKFTILILVFLLSISIGFAAANPVEFYGAKSYSSGKQSYYKVLDGDFDGDGRIDSMVYSLRNLSVYFGSGNGEFSTPASNVYEFFENYNIPAVADFNNDGRSDIVFTRQNSSSSFDFAVYFGNADRTFSAPVFSNIGTYARYPIVVDFDGDGKMDLLGIDGDSSTKKILFYKGAGDGTFTIGGQMNIGNNFSNVLIAGNFNADNLPDVIFTENSSQKIVPNMGNGTFGTPVTINTTGQQLASYIAADINNDGFLDIAGIKGSYNNSTVVIYRGNGNFGFTATPSFVVETNELVYIQAAVNLDGNNFPDLVFSSKNRTIVGRQTGDGIFADEENYLDGGNNGLFVRDLNGDGFGDIVASQSTEFAVAGSGSLSVLINEQNGFFKSGLGFATSPGVRDIATADFNNDNLKDFVMVNRGGGNQPGDIIVVTQQQNPLEPGLNKTESQNLKFRLNNILQSKSGGNAVPEGGGLDCYKVVTGKFKSDNFTDIIAVGHGANGIPQNAMILKNNGNNLFTSTLFQIGTGDIYDVATADFNNDGKLDLLTGNYSGVFYSKGNGDGTFASPINLNNLQSGNIKIGDFNNDDKPDFAILNYAQLKINIFTNNGAGVFTNTESISVNAGIGSFTSADMNGDGRLDFVFINGLGSDIGVGVIIRNNDGSSNSPLTYPLTNINAANLTLNDFNGDGRIDVAAITGTNSVTVLTNQGGGILGQEVNYGGGVQESVIVSDDLNNDQKADLIVGFTTSYNSYVKILMNQSKSQAQVNKSPYDFDGDGKSDVGIFRPSGGEWWINRSATNVTVAAAFGSSTDKITPGDFTGDGKADMAFFRPSNGFWYILRSEDFSFYGFNFGANGDIPVAADFDGDGKTDTAVFRPSNTGWYIQKSSGGIESLTFGLSGDFPVVADYDGDGKADIAITRINNGVREWWIRRSSDNQIFSVIFGDANDKAVQGDYTGDGKADIAFYRPSSGFWYILRSENLTFYGFPFGISTDTPTPGDYDGDGKFDAAVFRSSNTGWYQLRTTQGFTAVTFGLSNDIPIPTAYVP